jgi:hypothetical protein
LEQVVQELLALQEVSRVHSVAALLSRYPLKQAEHRRELLRETQLEGIE